MKLTRNFTLEELTATSYSLYQTQPTQEQLLNLMFLAATILQPLRDAFGQPIYINSGFRSLALNYHVGGVKGSYHLQGLAADLRINSENHARQLFDLLKKNGGVDTCLFERKGSAKWLHVQTTRLSKPRNHFNFNFS